MNSATVVAVCACVFDWGWKWMFHANGFEGVIKKARFRGLLIPFLFDLCFLVHHVLPYHGIVLFGLHLVRMQTFVLGRRVVVAGSGT